VKSLREVTDADDYVVLFCSRFRAGDNGNVVFGAFANVPVVGVDRQRVLRILVGFWRMEGIEQTGGLSFLGEFFLGLVF
jgi:hypothetical protein